jgi:hypothetical protein
LNNYKTKLTSGKIELTSDKIELTSDKIELTSCKTLVKGKIDFKLLNLIYQSIFYHLKQEHNLFFYNK